MRDSDTTVKPSPIIVHPPPPPKKLVGSTLLRKPGRSFVKRKREHITCHKSDLLPSSYAISSVEEGTCHLPVHAIPAMLNQHWLCKVPIDGTAVNRLLARQQTHLQYFRVSLSLSRSACVCSLEIHSTNCCESN